MEPNEKESQAPEQPADPTADAKAPLPALSTAEGALINESPSDEIPPDETLPDAIDMESTTLGEAAHSLLSIFNYSTSLPERTLRSAGALAGGLVRESANWLIPSAFRNSKSYSIFVQQMLDFVASDIGGVRKRLAADKTTQEAEVDLARKTVGNLIDMASFATFHVSPITVLAIFSDVAYGSKVYMQQLSERLKQQGIIDEETVINGTTELITAIEEASGNMVNMFDQPPVSVEGLRKTLEHTQAAIGRLDPTQVLPISEIDQLWRQMELAADEQHASIWDISATISMVALGNIQSIGKGTVVSLEIAGNMFHEHIVDHYWSGLRQIERKGLISTLSEASEPYLEAVWKNFAVDRKTWTEQLLSGELWRWGWSQLSWPKLSSQR